MPSLARYRKQRRVTRGAWKTRFTLQRDTPRGSTTGASLTTPTLSGITPTSGTAAGSGLTITCTGTNYVTGITKATVNLTDQYTTFVSATSVTFVFPRPAIAGTYSVNVHNGNKFSTTARTFTVT